jgi:hypothetical protein
MDYATVDEATLRAVAAAWAGEGHEQQPPAADKDDSATPSERALKPVSPLGNASEKTAVKVERGDEVPADGRAIAHLKAQVRMRTVSARLRAAAGAQSNVRFAEAVGCCIRCTQVREKGAELRRCRATAADLPSCQVR